MMQDDLRPSRLILEELSDLTGYLESVPRHLRISGALRSYEVRLGELQNEFVMSYIGELFGKTDLAAQARSDLEKANTGIPLERVAEQFSTLEEEYRSGLRKLRHLQGALNYTAILAAGSGIAASALGWIPLATSTAIATLVALLIVVLLRVPDRGLERQRQLDSILSLKNYLFRVPEQQDQVPAARALIALASDWAGLAGKPPTAAS